MSSSSPDDSSPSPSPSHHTNLPKLRMDWPLAGQQPRASARVNVTWKSEVVQQQANELCSPNTPARRVTPSILKTRNSFKSACEPQQYGEPLHQEQNEHTHDLNTTSDESSSSSSHDSPEATSAPCLPSSLPLSFDQPPSPDLRASPSPPPPQNDSSCCSVAVAPCQPTPSIDSIIVQYQPVYPTWRLILTQLQQASLWDRLFTHCTGRDLLCKIVQHSAGLLRCLIYWYDKLMRRLAQHAAFRRMFFHGRDVKELPLPTTAAATDADASSPSTAAIESASTEPDEAWVPPSSSSTPNSLSHCLNHLSHTMYRSRQVLRLGRWLYDLPDVKEAAMELWYGASVEEKSAEEQEGEEEWEEHERIHVVRGATRRGSFELQKQLGGGGVVSGTSNLLLPGSARDSTSALTAARGTFLFPLSSSRIAASASSASAGSGGGMLHKSSSLPQLPATSDSVASSASSMGSTIPSANHRRISYSSIACTDQTEQERTPDDSSLTTSSTELALVPSNSKAAEGSADACSTAVAVNGEEEEDESMTVLEYTVGVIDLTNSLMGLIIDAADDIEFISELGVLPEKVGEGAGKVSAVLWLVSGAIDVAMCCYKLHVYRSEMRDALQERLDELQQQESSRVATFLAAAREQFGEDEISLKDMPDSMPRQSSAPSSTSSIAVVNQSIPCRSLLRRPLKSVSTSPTTLCTIDCDVDCFHIEYLRFYRYLGELGLALCGVVLIDGEDVTHPCQAILEASGLFSGVSTFVKRAATHARSKKFAKLRPPQDPSDQMDGTDGSTPHAADTHIHLYS